MQFLANEHYENVQKQNKKIVVSNKHLKIFILVPDGVSLINYQNKDQSRCKPLNLKINYGRVLVS